MIRFVLIASLIGCASTAFATALNFEERTIDLGASMSYFSTTSNFKDNGNIGNLDGSNSFEQYLFSVSGSYDFSNSFSMFSAVDISETESITGAYKRRNFAPRSITIGASYLLAQIWGDWIPQIFVNQPLQSISNSTDDVVISEGVTQLDLRINFRKNFGWLDWVSYIGYDYLSGGKAGLATYGTEFQLPVFKLQAGGGVSGFYTVTDDDYIKNPSQRTVVINRVNGGSLKYNSVNPSVMQANFWLGADLGDSSTLQVGGAQSLQGTRYANGLTVFVSYHRFFDSREVLPQKPTDYRRDENVEKFRVEQDSKGEEALFLDKVHNPKKIKRREKTRDELENDRNSKPVDIKIKKSKKRLRVDPDQGLDDNT